MKDAAWGSSGGEGGGAAASDEAGGGEVRPAGLRGGRVGWGGEFGGGAGCGQGSLPFFDQRIFFRGAYAPSS